MDLELVRAVLEGVALAIDLAGKLARLAGGHKAGAQPVGDRRADEKASGLGANHLGDALAEEVLGHCVHASREALLVCDERGDVLEDDAGLRVVRDVHDEVLVREGPFDLLRHVLPPVSRKIDD